MRPAFLVAEVEPHHGLSARKLVLESFRYNVLTAYCPGEAIETFRAFPGIAAVIINAELQDYECVIAEMKRLNPDKKIILLRPSEHTRSEHADMYCNAHDPEALLDLLRRHFGEPEPTT